jgi:hypothetical protein
MAPEMVRDHTFDARADLWSTGVILYEALYGHAPLHSTTMDELLAKITDLTPIVFPTALSVSAGATELLTLLLQRDCTNRSFAAFFEHPLIGLSDPPAEPGNIVGASAGAGAGADEVACGRDDWAMLRPGRADSAPAGIIGVPEVGMTDGEIRTGFTKHGVNCPALTASTRNTALTKLLCLNARTSAAGQCGLRYVTTFFCRGGSIMHRRRSTLGSFATRSDECFLQANIPVFQQHASSRASLTIVTMTHVTPLKL